MAAGRSARVRCGKPRVPAEPAHRRDRCGRGVCRRRGLHAAPRGRPAGFQLHAGIDPRLGRYSVCFPRAFLLVALAGCATASARYHPRVVVTTDPELDDANSLIRYLLYSTDFRTEGLIYASSGFHWKGDGAGKKVSVPNREYSRFGLNLCPCESWRWAPDEHFIDLAVANYEQV